MVSDQSKLGLVIMSAVDYQEYEQRDATPQAATGIYRSTNSFFLPNSRITITQNGDQITIEVTLLDPVALVLPYADASDIPAAIPEYPIIEVGPDAGDGSGEGDADGDGVGDTIDGNASGDVDGTNDDGTGEADGDDGTGDSAGSAEGDGVGDADGDDSSGVGAGDGGAQDSNTWLAMTPTAAPSARYGHTAVWTGERMIVWGGSQSTSTAVDDGGIYDPIGDTWAPISLDSHSPSNRREHSAVWTGNKMIVWGGVEPSVAEGELSNGAIYDPSTDSWSPMSNTNAPEARRGHVAVWTGDQMIVWGGVRVASPTEGGGVYDLNSDSWGVISTSPGGRINFSAVWTGSNFSIWGGEDPGGVINSGWRFDPIDYAWTAMNAVGSPSERKAHTAIWDGSAMVVWGGIDDTNTTYNDGYSYNPEGNSWSAINSAGAPEARSQHSAIWTGENMIVWGGATDSGDLNTGGTYGQSSEAWSALTNTDAPAPRRSHTAVWTGTRMIVWGGWYWNAGVSPLNSGGIYIP